MTTPMKDRIHQYDNDDVDMIVVDATNTSQETDNIFSFLYRPELNTDIDEFLFNLERLHNDNTNT